jgi:ABC-type glycerol-3-phosphate transport system permease component
MASTSPMTPLARQGRTRPLVGQVSRHGVMLAFTLLAMLPLYFMAVSAFKTRAEYVGNRLGLPHSPTFSTMISALKGGELLLWLTNSLFITGASVLISTVVAAFGAYSLSLMRWRTGPVVLGLLIALLAVPPIVLIVPIFEIAASYGWLNSYTTLIVIYSGMMVPFSTFLLYGFFSAIPRTLIEAARIDGARVWRVLWEIVLPLSGSALMTVAIVQSLWVWNEVLIAIVFMQSETLRTLMVGLTIFNGRYRIDVPVVMAGMLWATVPMMTIYLLGQRFFIRGLTAGAVKG